MSVRLRGQGAALVCWHRLFGWPIEREVNAGARRMGFPPIRAREWMLPWVVPWLASEATERELARYAHDGGSSCASK